MKIIKTIKELRKIIKDRKASGESVGFVPTMGYLHSGHVALMEKARIDNDFVVVSIYVNPTQFGSGEDIADYPRDIDRDIDICRNNQIDIVFVPSSDEMYQPGYQTSVNINILSNRLCGMFRESHFEGVATVVTKFFNIVDPGKAYFGTKDYQQLKIIERLVKDLDFNIDIIGVETVRDNDGLATSSRNIYLDTDEREEACFIYKSLCKAERLLKDGLKNSDQIKKAMHEVLDKKDLIKIQYIEIVDPDNLETVENIDGSALVAIAAFVGKARLIDNLLISELGDSKCCAQC
jgi:pantoate--beta-alanine ligase